MLAVIQGEQLHRFPLISAALAIPERTKGHSAKRWGAVTEGFSVLDGDNDKLPIAGPV